MLYLRRRVRLKFSRAFSQTRHVGCACLGRDCVVTPLASLATCLPHGSTRLHDHVFHNHYASLLYMFIFYAFRGHSTKCDVASKTASVQPKRATIVALGSSSKVLYAHRWRRNSKTSKSNFSATKVLLLGE